MTYVFVRNLGVKWRAGCCDKPPADCCQFYYVADREARKALKYMKDMLRGYQGKTPEEVSLPGSLN
jgi:hypothetical protein